MKKILLVGNPNVGKSVVFSRLTGVHVVASNYSGTTVEYTKGNMPGILSRLRGFSCPTIFRRILPRPGDWFPRLKKKGPYPNESVPKTLH